jgi:Tol biopolymer transport system component
VVAAEFSLSENGALAYHLGAPGSSETLELVGPNGRTTVTLPEAGTLDEPVFSPDGGRIALRLVTPSRNDIWVFDRAQETFELLTTEGQNFFPIWTPDRRRIAFQSEREGAPGAIYWAPADGSGTAELLFRQPFPVVPASWLPGGKSLVFAALGSDRGGTDIGVFSVGDTVPRWLVATPFNERQPQVSPDGRWLAYTSNRSGDPEVYVQAMSGEGGRVRVSAGGGHSPRWAPDGRALYFVSNAQLIAATVTPEGDFRVTGRATRFTGVTDINEQNSNYDIHPNGTEVLIINQQGDSQAQMVWILNWPEILRAKRAAR